MCEDGKCQMWKEFRDEARAAIRALKNAELSSKTKVTNQHPTLQGMNTAPKEYNPLEG